MAKILNNTRSNVGDLLGLTRPNITKPTIATTKRTDRASAEAIIADNNKSKYSSFSKMVSAPTVLCTYFPINDDHTSYSESSKNIKDNVSAKKFDMISDFVLNERDSEDLQDNESDERRINISLSSKTSFIQPGVLVPKEGDHLVLTAQGKIAKPYQVTKVTPRKFLDKEIWEIQYSESTIFTFDGLMSRVVRRRRYIPDNVGTNSAVIVDEDKADKLSMLSSIIEKLNRKYVEAFYDEIYDALVFKPYRHENMFHFNYYSNERMQEVLGLLKYGYDKSTLFVKNVYAYDAVETNFDNSLYVNLLERSFYLRDEIEEDGIGKPTVIGSDTLIQAMNDREAIFEEYRGIKQYDSKYVYGTRLYLRPKNNHLILTRYYNSKLWLIDMFDSAGFFDKQLKSAWVNYEIKSPYITKFLDWFMDGNFECMISNINILKRFSPSKYCIDDYLGVPLLILALTNTLENYNSTNDYGTYA